MPNTFRVLTWNLCCDTYDRPGRLRAAADAIAVLDPHIVLLQETFDGAAATVARAIDATVVAHSERPSTEPDSDTAVLSRWPALASGHGWLPLEGDNQVASTFAYAVLDTPGGPVAAYSAHLAWGGRAEPVRARQAVYLDELADHVTEQFPSAVHVLGGDFNTLPSSRTIRFLTGLDEVDGRGTFWVDAWAEVGRSAGYTSDPRLPQAVRTARGAGIDRPQYMPHRRIDYLMARGWAYGRRGCPVDAFLADAAHVSDHHGIVVDLLAD